jgi:DNA-binding CsgD family transcriptional regulator
VADAWCDVREAGTVGPVVAAKVVDAALAAADGGQGVIAVIALHELVRLGAAARAVDPLRQVGRDLPSSWLVDLVTERATAQHHGDDEDLRRLIRRATGRWPGAVAELHLARHQLALRRGDEVAAARAAFLARRCADELGAQVPWPLSGVRSPLTARELDVVHAVASGGSNREVAQAAGVSVRTVEHQLNSAYRKLGLASRRELVAFLAR